jgi:hypothetical protein
LLGVLSQHLEAEFEGDERKRPGMKRIHLGEAIARLQAEVTRGEFINEDFDPGTRL